MKLIIGNQKAYLNRDEVEEFIKIIHFKQRGNVIICANTLYIDLYNKTDFVLGAQNVSVDKNGPTTGETSASQLKSMGVDYCIVGHSERRLNQKETDRDISIKIKRLFENDIVPILCVGETLDQRKNNLSTEVITKQLSAALNDFTDTQLSNVIIAYEPIWAISDGITPSKIPDNEVIEECILSIKKFMSDHYGIDIKVLYGGSVNMKNVDQLNRSDIIDGYLIGSASRDCKEFSYIISTINDKN